MIGGRTDLVPIEYDAEADRAEWVAARMSGIGGSDVAAILGEDPFKSAIDVWQERVTGGSALLDNVRTTGGRWLEPFVLESFARGGDQWPRSGGECVLVKPPTVYRADRPWQRGSADSFLFERERADALIRTSPRPDQALVEARPDALVEAKTHGWFGSRGYDLSDDGDPIIGVPPAKRIQCASYMALYEVDVCYLAALVDTHHRKTFVLQRDKELEAMMLEECEHFWTRYVLTGEPPPVDGSKRYGAFLRERYRKHGAELVGSVEQVDLAVESLMAIKSDLKALKKDEELAAQVIKKHIGENAGTRTAHGTVTWHSQPSGKLRDGDARDALYLALGWTDTEIAEFEAKYEQPAHRVLRLPKAK